MKKTNYFQNSVIQQAIQLGFDFSQFSNHDDVQEINCALIEFFEENTDLLENLEDECDVISHGSSQHVEFMNYSCTGEILDWSKHWREKPDTKIYHSEFCFIDKTEGLVKYMKLFCYVGENDFNTIK